MCQENSHEKRRYSLHIFEETGITKAEAEEAMIAFLDAITKGLKNRAKVTLTGFGSFSVVERKDRMGKNPKTGKILMSY